MKLLLVVNPTASSVTARRRVAVEDILAAGHELSVVVTERRDHATELARRAAREGVDVVVVLGGDGTINEAANGLAGSSTALGALPGGSTSVFARTLGFTNDLVVAAKQLNAALEAGSRRRVEMGTANGRRYLFNLGVGFDAEVVGHVEGGTLKSRFGQAAFVYSALVTWLSQEDRTKPHLSVKIAGEEATYGGSFVLCLNTNPYTYLGYRPLSVTPDAVAGRGLVSVTVRSLSVGTLLGVFGSAVGKGTRLRRHRRVDYRTDLATLEVRGHGPVPYQVDGDYLGEAEELSIGYHPDALHVVAP